MRAVVLKAVGPPSNLVPTAAALRPSASNLRAGEVRVRVAACAVAFRDTIDRSGGFPMIQLPTILGHEFAGTVDAVGPETTRESNLAVGDRVASFHWAQAFAWPSPFDTPRAMESFFAIGCPGGYAESVVSHESGLTKVPAGWSAAEAAPAVSTFGTVWQGIKTAQLRDPALGDERILVTGASGGVGTAAVQLLSRLGHTVVGTTSSEDTSKAAHIMAHGAAAVVSTKNPRWSADVKKAFGGASATLVLEAVGGPTFDQSLRSLEPGGRIVLVGNVTNAVANLPLGLAIVKSLSVIGSDSCEASEMEKCFAFLTREELRPQIDRILPLEEAADAHALLEAKGVKGRLVLAIDGGEAAW